MLNENVGWVVIRNPLRLNHEAFKSGIVKNEFFLCTKGLRDKCNNTLPVKQRRICKWSPP